VKVTGYQLSEMVRKVSGCPIKPSSSQDPVEYLTIVCDEGFLRVPFDPGCTFWIPDRFPVLADVYKSANSSLLLQQLASRCDDTGLVVDSLLVGSDAVWVSCLMSSLQEAGRWVTWMNPKRASAIIRTFDENHLVLAPLIAFRADHGDE
jgi:hypothetical protein